MVYKQSTSVRASALRVGSAPGLFSVTAGLRSVLYFVALFVLRPEVSVHWELDAVLRVDACVQVRARACVRACVRTCACGRAVCHQHPLNSPVKSFGPPFGPVREKNGKEKSKLVMS